MVEASVFVIKHMIKQCSAAVFGQFFKTLAVGFKEKSILCMKQLAIE